MSGILHLVIAADLTKSAAEHRNWILEASRSLVESCRATLNSLVGYGSTAVPLLEEDATPSLVADVLGFVPFIPGVPEPARAVAEAAGIIHSSSPGPRPPSLIVVFWSMPRRPRIPAALAPLIAESAGAKLVVVGLQYGLPRWARNYDLGRAEVVYRRRMRPGDLARKIGCPPR